MEKNLNVKGRKCPCEQKEHTKESSLQYYLPGTMPAQFRHTTVQKAFWGWKLRYMMLLLQKWKLFFFLDSENTLSRMEAGP